MDLSAEDNLRINVLLAQNLQAVRIDESKMMVYALTDRGEAKIKLNPNCKDDKYIKQVKSLLSTHVMGSPGGYPVFLKRWTRMGQARDETLGQLLLLGEPEAVVAAVHAKGLSDELAARAWWAMPTAENARRMLEKQAIVNGKTGKVLAQFLIEFLPFEEDPKAMIDSVRLVLQPGLISEQEKSSLWSRAKSKRSFYVGFLHTLPDNLPETQSEHHLLTDASRALAAQLAANNACAGLLLKVFSAQGQAFIKTAEAALKKPADQYVVESLLNAIAQYFVCVKPGTFVVGNMDAICAQCSCVDAPSANTVIASWPAAKTYLGSMMILSCLTVELVNPIFARTDAIGSVMRKKISPIADPILEYLGMLQR
jgi:hypothetical protein